MTTIFEISVMGGIFIHYQIVLYIREVNKKSSKHFEVWYKTDNFTIRCRKFFTLSLAQTYLKGIMKLAMKNEFIYRVCPRCLEFVYHPCLECQSCFNLLRQTEFVYKNEKISTHFKYEKSKKYFQ